MKALFGEIPIRGHLPVSIPNVAERGAGIERQARVASGEVPACAHRNFQALAFAIAAAFSLLVRLPACSLNVKKNEKGEGEKVDIQTPVGGIHVSQDANRARHRAWRHIRGRVEKEKSSQHDGNNANVNISSGFFGVKVVAIEFRFR